MSVDCLVSNFQNISIKKAHFSKKLKSRCFYIFNIIYFSLHAFTYINVSAQNIDKIGYTETGKASYYPDDRKGALTSSGEQYNMYALEGAHKYIAFNTLVEVTNLENQQKAFVRINDRPYTNERIMDVTLATAKKLGMLGKTTTNIKIEIVANNVFRKPIQQFQSINTPPKNETTLKRQNTILANTTAVSLDLGKEKLETVFKPVHTYKANGQTAYPKGFGIQIGSFSDIMVALEKAQELERLQLNNVYIQSGWSNNRKIYRVIFGDFLTKEEAQFMEKNLKNGFKGIFVKQHLLLE